MENVCVKHPSSKTLNICHSCGDYYCSDRLNEGKEYYYYNIPECYEKCLKENPEAKKKWSKNRKRVFWTVFVLCILFNLSRNEADPVYGISYGIGQGAAFGFMLSWIVSLFEKRINIKLMIELITLFAQNAKQKSTKKIKYVRSEGLI